MLEFVLMLISAIIWAFVAHELTRIGNEHLDDLDMSPNWSAFIGCLFGLTGVFALVVYGAVKLMIKRMIKK